MTVSHNDSPNDRAVDTWTVTITETTTYERTFTRVELAALVTADLDTASALDLREAVTGNPSVEDALQRHGNVESTQWHVAPAGPVTNRPRPAATHDHATTEVLGRDLSSRHVLVGEAGGLSAVYQTRASSAMPGLVSVETEHGPLYLDPDHPYLVVAEA